MNTEIGLQINNTNYCFVKPLTIFQACLTKHIYVPRFCYHVSLKIVGNCRMCLIEEKSSIKPVASCAVSITNGMHIYTNTEIVKRAREGVIEYLLVNHPLDCPICDQGGECDLQDQSMVFGSDSGRFYEFKRTTPNKNLGFLIKTFLNRCIHCARCTRFLEDVAGTPALGLLGRGYKTEISGYTQSFLKSEISGNIIDLCPVGALTSKPYAFKARPWELITVPSFDIMDAFGSNIQLDFRGLELLRILPKPNKYLNEEWISDKTRFFYDAISVQRLTSPYIFFSKNNFKKTTWKRSLSILRNYLLNNIIEKKMIDYLTYNTGDFLDIESSFFLKKTTSLLGFTTWKNNHENKISPDFRTNYGCTQLTLLNSLDENNLPESLFLIHSNPRFESPLLNLKIRRFNDEFGVEVFKIGFISNTNHNFIHMNHILNHYSLNKILFFKNPLIFAPTYVELPNQLLNKINLNITNMVSKETNLIPNWSGCHVEGIKFNLGFPELQNMFYFSNFTINFLHHMEDSLIKDCSGKQMLLPTKFFFEKTSTYINNFFIFYNTSHHYSFFIDGTKDDWKILQAILEVLHLSKFSVADVKDLFGFIAKTIYVSTASRPMVPYFNKSINNSLFIKKSIFSSTIFNYFTNNIITRISDNLNLSSKKFLIKTDYLTL
jgi:NADH-quinone oxidoreductase chain G